MLAAKYTKTFSKAYAALMKSGKNIQKLDAVIRLLAKQEKLPVKYKDHKLKGSLSAFRECHIEENWLLVYHIAGDTLYLDDTGTHAEVLR